MRFHDPASDKKKKIMSPTSKVNIKKLHIFIFGLNIAKRLLGEMGRAAHPAPYFGKRTPFIEGFGNAPALPIRNTQAELYTPRTG